MAWASTNGYVVFTNDLDFGTTLALTHASGPSVIQARADDLFPDHLGPMLLAALRHHEALLTAGALVVVDEARARVRVLPLQ
jgi:predicted nuclease of predicted toxin-antitoxin system